MSNIFDTTRYTKTYTFFRTRPRYQTGGAMSITITGNGVVGSQTMDTLNVSTGLSGTLVGTTFTLEVSGAQGPTGPAGSKWYPSAGVPAITASYLDWSLDSTTGNSYFNAADGNNWSLWMNLTGPSGSVGPTGDTGPHGNLSGSSLYNFYNTSSLSVNVGSGSNNFWTIPFIGAGAPEPLLNANQFFIVGVRVFAYDKTIKSDVGSYDCTLQLLLSSSNVLSIVGTPAEESRFISGSGLSVATPSVSGSSLLLYGGSNNNTGSFSAYLQFNGGIILS